MMQIVIKHTHYSNAIESRIPNRRIVVADRDDKDGADIYFFIADGSHRKRANEKPLRNKGTMVHINLSMEGLETLHYTITEYLKLHKP